MSGAVEDLTAVFEALGAEEPAGWAASQVDEGIPQLHRFLFLKKAWGQVVGEADDSWLDQRIADFRKRPTAPFSGAGRAIERMLSLGVPRSDIVDLVRAMQVETLSGMCYLLSDPGLTEEEEDLAGELGWALVTDDGDEDAPAYIIGGLHESVLETDPTGREMRPRVETV